MKISNSKKQLAKLLIEAGVTQFPDGANWAAQDKDKSPIESSPLSVMFYSTKPLRPQKGDGYWFATVPLSELVGKPVKLSTLIPNWHQTALSRDEFDQIVAESVEQSKPDADEWIEWGGGECPVCIDDVVDVMQLDGHTYTARAVNFHWLLKSGSVSVAAYRLHKTEQAKPDYCDSVTRSIPKSSDKPTIEQLAADYRNAKDYADRKQQEADEAKAGAEAKLAELVAAGKALGLVLAVAGLEPEIVITDWRDLQVGDVVWYGGDDELSPGEYHVMGVESPNYVGYRTVQVNGGNGGHWIDTREGWGFIRRPTKGGADA